MAMDIESTLQTVENEGKCPLLKFSAVDTTLGAHSMLGNIHPM